ncbi:tyrosine-type recombinase/integrase [Spirillospora sp. NPDC127200]
MTEGKDEVLEPTALLRPGSVRGAASPRLGPPDATLVPGAVPGDGEVASAPQAPPPAPLLVSVGDIPGLSPRYQRGQGEVPAANVELVDRLSRSGPQPEWPTVAAWLQSRKSVATRRDYLHCLAAFLRWLELAAPGHRLWSVTEDLLDAYIDQLATATGPAKDLVRGGKPLKPATVAQRVSALKSLYAYALRRRVTRYDPAAFVELPEVSKTGMTPAISKSEATRLLDGAEAIATDHPADAAAVALLVGTGMRAGELEALPVGAFARDAGHQVARFRVKGGETNSVPIVPRVWTLVEPLTIGRSGHDHLLLRADGRPWDRWRITTALRRAARAAGVDPKILTPHVLRATAATLLLDAGVPKDKVQQMLKHASQTTTERYDRGQARLGGHAAYRLAGILDEEGPSR